MNHRALNFQEWNHTKTLISFRWHHRRVSGLEGHWWCPARPARAGPRWRVRHSEAQPLRSCFPESGLPYFPPRGLLQSHWMSFPCQSKNTYTFKWFRPYGLWDLIMINVVLVYQNDRNVDNINIPRLECSYLLWEVHPSKSPLALKWISDPRTQTDHQSPLKYKLAL